MPLSGLEIGIRLAVLLGIVGLPLIVLGLRAAWIAFRKSSLEEVSGPTTQFNLN